MRSGKRHICRAFVWAALVAALSSCPRAGAQTADQAALINREYAIKAGFLYHFSTYVVWPPAMFPTAETPFVIGVYQTDPFGTALKQIAATKTVGGRTIEIRLVKAADEITACHILFVPLSVTAEQRAAALRATRGALILVVGETDDFISQGGDAQFFLEGNKVRFAFSDEIAGDGDLKVSSKLLTLAKIISRHN